MIALFSTATDLMANSCTFLSRSMCVNLSDVTIFLGPGREFRMGTRIDKRYKLKMLIVLIFAVSLSVTVPQALATGKYEELCCIHCPW